jgi:hypothetical protein
VVDFDHTLDEPVLESSMLSTPRTDGFDFPLRMPPDFREKLNYLMDLVRAAGIQIEIVPRR